ncbi:MAG: mechanosensitive ion channel [Planctomycetes bacterium]|nr:mechanosensitive ion channel [Planctomycetota bacterium]
MVRVLAFALLAGLTGWLPQGASMPKTLEEAAKLREQTLERAAAAEKDSTKRGLAAIDEGRVLRRLADAYGDLEALLRREKELEAELTNLPARRAAADARRRNPAPPPVDKPTEPLLQELTTVLERERSALTEIDRRLASAERLVSGGSYDERERLRLDRDETERSRRALQVGESSFGPTAAAFEASRLELRVAYAERLQRFLDERDRRAGDLVETLRAEADAQRAQIAARARQLQSLSAAYLLQLRADRDAAEAAAQAARRAATTELAESTRGVREHEARTAELAAAALGARVETARIVFDDGIAGRLAAERVRFQELREQLQDRTPGNEERWIESYRSVQELRRSKEVQDSGAELRVLRATAKQARADAAAARRESAHLEAREGEERQEVTEMFEADRAAGRAREADAEAFLASWEHSKREHREALSARASAASRLADAAGARTASIQQFLETLDEEEQFVRAHGLFVRVGTQIDFESLRMAVLDAVSIVRNAPRTVQALVANARTYLFERANLPRVLAAAVLFPLALLLVIVTRRAALNLSKRMPVGHALTVPERAQRLAIGTARRMALTVFTLLAVVLAVRLFAGDPALNRAVESGVIVVFLVRLALAVVSGCFRPDDAALRLVPVGDGTAKYVARVAVLASLPFTAIAIPRNVLEALGYAGRNAGFMELLARMEQGLLTIAVVLVFARESVLEELLPRSHNRALEFLRALLLRLRPAALFFAIAVFVLRLLGYEFLARYLTSISIGGTAIVALASVGHRAILQLWDRVLPRLDLGAADDAVAAQKTALLNSMVKVGALVGCFAGAWFAFVVLLRVGTTELQAVDVGVVGGRRFSARDVAFFALSLIGTGILASWTRKGLSLFALPHTKLDVGTRYAIAVVSAYLVIVFGFVASLGFLGFELRDFAIVLGAAGFGVGLGMQESAANFLNGLILLFSRPVKVGDVIESEGRIGEVIDITISTTRILTPENYEILIPNREIVGRRLVNQTGRDPKVRAAVRVGVAYGSDAEKVRSVLLGVIAGRKEVLPKPEPIVVLLDFGDSALVFELRYWTAISMRFDSETAMRVAVLSALRREGIEVPFPQRELSLKGPVTVQMTQPKG